MRGVPRYWLREEALGRFEASEEQRSWHGPGAVGNLLQYDMPKVEAVNAIADQYAKANGVTVAAVHWVERGPMAAVVGYATHDRREPGYVVDLLDIPDGYRGGALLPAGSGAGGHAGAGHGDSRPVFPRRAGGCGCQ